MVLTIKVRAVTHASGAESMRPFTEAPYLPRGTRVDAALASSTASGQARRATSSCCVIGACQSAYQPARAQPPLRKRGRWSGAMSTYPRAALGRDRHLAAVARRLGWARESAARGDYADALRPLELWSRRKAGPWRCAGAIRRGWRGQGCGRCPLTTRGIRLARRSHRTKVLSRQRRVRE
jgi:hypothetical protein